MAYANKMFFGATQTDSRGVTAINVQIYRHLPEEWETFDHFTLIREQES